MNDKLNELEKQNKKLIKDYEAELTTLKADRASKYQELRKEAESREKAEIQTGIKKGVEKVTKGKKLEGLSSEEIKQGNQLMGQIHKTVNEKGLTKKEFSDIKMQYGYARSLSGKAKRMSIPQLEAVLQAVQKARPKIVNYKHVITPKTERKIQSLKDNLIDKMQMTEEAYTAILKSEGVYKEAKYVDASNFITETQGKDIIYRLIGESDILRETLPYTQAVEKLPAIKKLIDKERASIKADRDKGMKDPKELNSSRVFFQKMEEITGAPIYRLFTSLIDTTLENKEEVSVFIHGFEEYKDIVKDEEAKMRVAQYISSKSNLEDKPEYPKNITEQEIKVAKEIEDIFKDYQVKARTQKFLDNIEHPEDMPQYTQYKKEIDKAKDIYESKGYDDLVEYMKTQEWGIIKNGYDPYQIIVAKIRMYKPKPITFGKSNIKVRTDIEYKEHETDIFQRLFSYKKSMDNLVTIRPKMGALITLIDQNLSKFKNPKRVEEGVEIFLKELRGYNRPEGLVERALNRVYAQAMQTIIMPSLVMFGRNILQNISFGFDKTIIIDPRNKKLSTDRMTFLNTYMTQMQSMKIDWFMTGEKPLPGLVGLTKLVNKIGIYPYSDQANRILGFWGRINQIDRAFNGVDKNSTIEQLNKALLKAKFGDLEVTERIMALEILGKDDYEAMARYMARCYVADTEFQYNRPERSIAEMGRGKWLTNLMLFPRAYNELLLKHFNKFKKGTVKEKARAFKVLTSVIVGGVLVGEVYKKATGRRQNPYSPLNLLAYEPGGLAMGTVEAFSDVYSNTIMALNGDVRSMADLTTAIPRLADMVVPMYDYTLRAIEAAIPMSYRGQAVNKNIDRLVLRILREATTKRLNELGLNFEVSSPRADAYYVERNFYQKWQYVIAGAGVDVGIKEQQAETKSTTKKKKSTTKTTTTKKKRTTK